MLELIKEFLLPSQYIPHGHCYLWQTPLVGLHVASDGLIAFAYYAISLTLVFFVRKRPDLPFRNMFWLFGAFIVACGTTHLAEIWTLWYPTYWTSGVLKLFTAGVSLYTGVALVPIIPKVLSLRSPGELEAINEKLQEQIIDRLRAEVSLQEAKEELERRVLDRTVDLERVNKKLRVSEATLLEAQQIAHIGNWSYEVSTEQINWSTELFYIFGVDTSLGEPLTTEGMNFYVPEDILLLQEAAQNTLQTGEPAQLQLRIRRSDGEIRHTEIRIRTEVDIKGKVSRLYGTTQDITDLKKSEQAIAQLAAIVESSEDAIISMNLEGSVMSWNAGAEKIYGYNQWEVLGKNLVSLVTANPRISLEEETPENQISQYKTVHLTKDQQLIDVFLTQSFVKNHEGEITGVSVIARDISELQAVEKLKNEFVSTVSHELRTPLTSIRGSLGLLSSGRLGELSVQGKRMLEIAVNNTDRLVRLINDILDLELIAARKVSFARQSWDVVDLIWQAAEVMQPLAEKAEIRLIVKATTVKIWADPDRLIQTFTNLIGNAIKFSPPQTEIVIETSIDITPNPHQLIITFQDQGRGIPSDKLQTIFGRFQQIDASDSRQKGGTGLGLAICQSIIQQHEGKIWVESTVGQGSTFFVALPLNQEKSIISELKQPWLTVDDSNKGKRILIVEDDLDLARILMITFARHGFETIHAVNGNEAINFCEQIMPDLLILDLVMPSINGYMVVKWLRDHLPQYSSLPLLIYSAKELNHQEQVILQLGKTEFLTKSRISPEFLEKRVMTLLENRLEN